MGQNWFLFFYPFFIRRKKRGEQKERKRCDDDQEGVLEFPDEYISKPTELVCFSLEKDGGKTWDKRMRREKF